MNLLVNFIIESGISLSILGMIYYLFLRKETFLLQNRIFLAVSIIFSIVLPFIKIRLKTPQPIVLPEVTVTPYYNFLHEVTIYGKAISTEVERTVNSIEIIGWIYLAGIVFFSLRFILKLAQIYHIKVSGRKEKLKDITIIITTKEIAPFSFLKFIFINTTFEKKTGYEQILLHEIEHVKQHHSYDILLIEILTIIQWCNPIVWLLKRAIQENHEFLADRAVLDSGVGVGTYKHLLLNECVGNTISFANHFNYSLLKNRFKMMTKIKSNRFARLKYILGIFTAVGLLVLFSGENILEAKPTSSDESKEKVTVDIVGNALEFSGSKEKLNKILQMLSSKHNCIITKKNNPVEKLLVYTEISKPSVSISEDDDKNKIFSIAEETAEFPGGVSEMLKYLAQNIKYPAKAIKDSIQGRVYMKFVVNKLGKVERPVILRGVSPEIDAEAKRVIMQMNDSIQWKAARQSGRKVNIWYQVPITFRLQ